MNLKDFTQGLQNFLNSLSDGATVNQYMGLLRQALPALGGFAVALGFVSPEHMNAQVQQILTAAGPVLLFIGFIWSIVANNKSSIMKAAAGLSETTPSTDGKTIIVDDAWLTNVVAKRKMDRERFSAR
jgi:hypothetical protein